MNKMNKDYISLIEEGGIFSYSLAKGTFILPPNGFKLWNNIKEFLNKKFSDLNVEEVNLPSLIPLSLLSKEKEHVEGFSPEFFFVSSSKENQKNELVLRPTSETLFYEWFSRLVKSYRQLPVLYNQWCQVFRSEKNTKPFLRNSEFLWQEGHTLHLYQEDAKQFAVKILGLYKDYIENFLCISSVVGIKTEREKFAGALTTYTVECLLPDNQCLQIATAHFFSDKFSKAFGVKFNSLNNEQEFPYSTSWGSSTRVIGAMALSHSDQRGLIFPFNVAPIQISIVKYGDSFQIEEYSKSLIEMLSKKYRTKLYQFSSHSNINISISDKEGCPFKIIIGNKEVEQEALTISSRIENKKNFIKKTEVFNFIDENKRVISKNLFEKSFSNKNRNTYKADSYEDFLHFKENRKGLIVVPFCNFVDCEDQFKKDFSPLSFRCIVSKELDNNKGCIFCKRNFSYDCVVGRSY